MGEASSREATMQLLRMDHNVEIKDLEKKHSREISCTQERLKEAVTQEQRLIALLDEKTYEGLRLQSMTEHMTEKHAAEMQRLKEQQITELEQSRHAAETAQSDLQRQLEISRARHTTQVAYLTAGNASEERSSRKPASVRVDASEVSELRSQLQRAEKDTTAREKATLHLMHELGTQKEAAAKQKQTAARRAHKAHLRHETAMAERKREQAQVIAAYEDRLKLVPEQAILVKMHSNAFRSEPHLALRRCDTLEMIAVKLEKEVNNLVRTEMDLGVSCSQHHGRVRRVKWRGFKMSLYEVGPRRSSRTP
jgi:hypothetical protein